MKGDKAEDDFFQDLHADTPPVDRNLYFTDTDGYTGPMTQVVKDICPEQSNAVDHFMVVDHPPSFDCGPLPNLNASFSDFCDEGINLTPNADMMDMVVEDPKSTIDQQLPRDDMDNEGPIQKTSLDELEKNEELSVELSKSSQEPSADVEKNNEPAAEVVEVICIDVDVETDDLQFPSTFSSDVNVVLVNYVRSIFNANKRKRKTGKYNNSPYTSLPDTTPRAIRRSLRNKYKNISPTKPLDFDQNMELPPLEPFVENLERGPKAKRKEVNVPEAIQNFVYTKMEITFTFPWGGEDTFADVRFWKCLLAMDDCSSGWLRDEHLDVWVDLMWTFRPPDADWAMAGAFFCPCVMGNMLQPYWANGRKYPLPWKDVEKECPVQSDLVDQFMEVDHPPSSDCGSLPNLNSDLNDMVVDDPKNAIHQELPSDVVSEKNQDLANELGDIQRKAEYSPLCMKGDKAEDDFFQDLHADTPPVDRSLYFTDTDGYTGPMTQVVKDICPDQSNAVDHFMVVDHPPSFDCGPLLNLNASFSDFCDEGINLTPNATNNCLEMTWIWLSRIQKTSLDELEKNEELSVELSKSSQEPSADVEKNNEPAAEVVEVICIDVDVETDDLQFPSTFSSDVNVVLVNNVRSIFNANKRKRKTGKYNNSPYTSLPDTTPRAIRRSLRNKYKNISPTKPLDFDQNLELPPLEPFVENLERGPKAKRKEVNVPEAIQNFVDTKMEITFTFPWGGEDTFADVRFWKCLLAMDDCSSGWLRDEHLDVWVDLMWTFRPPDADWAMAGAFFCPCVMGNMLRPYWANGRKYPLPWKDVEKVLFPINEPGVHWATGELHIRTGVVTVFDSLPKFTRTRDWWNITMPDTFQRNLTKYLKDEGVLEAKGIETDGYGLTWKTGKDVPNQGCSYGDCGIWVCINLYRLGHKMSLKVNKPSSVGLAYRERMAEYFWKYKILYSSSR
ncbi:ulp1 protease family, C-terminal catalytic domain-containing protein [Artemisia annua]|uniref:Ulp1 protease family, C-terminal catalytic domain-containing protein n=1 Tax=Artemisia annua TaxID=35608 RepID=A0A2U1MZ36_ARTAN|nr:ulp1 protease family, C-terminal catalytic domain-containing protein [Artemisia annua]